MIYLSACLRRMIPSSDSFVLWLRPLNTILVNPKVPLWLCRNAITREILSKQYFLFLKGYPGRIWRYANSGIRSVRSRLNCSSTILSRFKKRAGPLKVMQCLMKVASVTFMLKRTWGVNLTQKAIKVNLEFWFIYQTHMMTPGHHTESDENHIFLRAKPDLGSDCAGSRLSWFWFIYQIGEKSSEQLGQINPGLRSLEKVFNYQPHNTLVCQE